MTKRYRLTPRAESDLNRIADYTRNRWGRPQMVTYLTALVDRFTWLAEHPKIGRARPELLAEIRSFREGSHIIFYRESETGIEIIGVPHMSMDIDTYFRDER